MTPAGVERQSDVVAWYAEGFSDRLGDRLLLFDNTGPALELLRLAPQLTSAPGFEAALRARVDQLKTFEHPVFARVRCVTTLDDPRPQLAVVSELVPGQRLSDLLSSAHHGSAKPNPGAAVWLLRQLLPALDSFHRLAPGIAHGLLGIDRIVVTPEGRLAITEYVLADGVERLGLSAAELWRHFGVAATDSPAGPVLDERSDVVQIGLLALSVLLGRPLGADEYPAAVPALLDEACSARHWMLAPMLRPWLRRALALEATGFGSATEAQAELDRLLPGVKGAWSRHLLPGAEAVAISGGAALGQPAGRPAAAAPVARSAVHPRGIEARREPSHAPAKVRSSTPGPVQAGTVTVGSTSAAATARGGGPAAAQVARLRRIAAVLATVAAVEAAALAVLIVGPPGRWLPATAASSGEPAADAPFRPAPASSAVLGESREGGAGQPVSPASITAGARAWLSLTSEIPVSVYVDGSFVGTAMQGRFRVAAGDHRLTLVNEAAGYRLDQTIRVRAGRTLALSPVLFREAAPRQP